MNRMILAGILIPFAGTTLGSAMVFFMRKEMNEKVQKLLLGFASGVMIAASVWSLLIPAIEMAEQEKTIAWIPASVGFLLGMGFLLLLDTITPHLHFTEDEPEGIPSYSLRRGKRGLELFPELDHCGDRRKRIPYPGFQRPQVGS